MPSQIDTFASGTSKLTDIVGSDSAVLSSRLREHQAKIFAPADLKTIRTFSPAEAADWLGVKEGYLRKLIADGKIPDPKNHAPRRSFSVEEIHEVRRVLDEGSRSQKGRRHSPARRDGEALQQIAVMNFKGGSGKTTTSIHLAQYLALRGFRVLAIDLDPQASLSAMLGHQPEFDVAENETIYGAVRYDTDKRPTAEVVIETYIPGLHLIPGNLELMEFEHQTALSFRTQVGLKDQFYTRISDAVRQVEKAYDVVVYDCPPQLGYLTLSAMSAATAGLITVHPQMLDLMSMSQFLNMMSDLVTVIDQAGGSANYSWMKYVLTRYEPSDIPQQQMFGFLKSLFGDRVMNAQMLKSTVIAEAGLMKQTLYEIDRRNHSRPTYDRAISAVNAVNSEIETLILKSWGRE